MLQSLSGNSSFVPRDTSPTIIKELGSPPWLTRHTIYNDIKKLRKEQQEELKKRGILGMSLQRMCDGVPAESETAANRTTSSSGTNSTMSSLTMSGASNNEKSIGEVEEAVVQEQEEHQSSNVRKRNVGGRPEGSTKQNKLLKKQKIEKAKEIAATNLAKKGNLIVRILLLLTSYKKVRWKTL